MPRRLGAIWVARDGWLPAAVLALLYLLSAVRVITPRALADPTLLYWRGWQDQLLYTRSTQAFAALDLTATAHWYPLLYPLFGAPFARWWPNHPFFLVDLVCVLLAFHGFSQVAKAFGIGRWCALAVFAATTLAPFGIAKSWIEPWTTTLSAALLWLALGAVARQGPVEPDRSVRLRTAMTLGVTIGLIPFARPTDTLVGLLIAAAGTMMMMRSGDRRALATAIGTALGPMVALGLLHLAIYGPALSPYMRSSVDMGFHLPWLGWKAYVILVDPRAWFGEGMGLVECAPWLLIGAAGLLAACISSVPERRGLALLLFVVTAIYMVLMLTYVDLLPTGLWRYNGIHYFKWLFPLFALFAFRFVLDTWRRPVLLFAAVPIVLSLLIRLDPVAVDTDTPARLIMFPAPAGAEWQKTYFADGSLTDRTGTLRNTYGYRQILSAGRIRAVALRRPFAGDERWIGDGHVRGQLNGTDTDGFAPLYLTGPWPKKPLRRYGLKVSFGLPCWVPPDRCSPPG